MIALSTMYFQRWDDQRDLGAFIAQAQAMGFDGIELSHTLGQEAVAAVDESIVRVAAVHHPCPRRKASLRCLTESDSSARQRAVEQLCLTVDTCAAVGAPVVVIHLGRLLDDFEVGRKLAFEVESRFLAGQTRSRRYRETLNALNDHVSQIEPTALARTVDHLSVALRYAADRGVRLALETGWGSLELPTPQGMAWLLDTLSDDPLGAWLDTGHVGAQANLGRFGFDDWRGAVGDRWLGVHCHDVVGLRDHLVPGMGGVDFDQIAGIVPPGAIVTCEVDWYFAEDELRAGLRVLRRAFNAA